MLSQCLKNDQLFILLCISLTIISMYNTIYKGQLTFFYISQMKKNSVLTSVFGNNFFVYCNLLDSVIRLGGPSFQYIHY